jgi:hypothetical protein
MLERASTTNNNGGGQQSANSEDQRKLAQRVADKVWALWREDLRRERERRGIEVTKWHP